MSFLLFLLSSEIIKYGSYSFFLTENTSGASSKAQRIFIWPYYVTFFYSLESPCLSLMVLLTELFFLFKEAGFWNSFDSTIRLIIIIILTQFTLIDLSKTNFGFRNLFIHKFYCQSKKPKNYNEAKLKKKYNDMTEIKITFYTNQVSNWNFKNTRILIFLSLIGASHLSDIFQNL